MIKLLLQLIFIALISGLAYSNPDKEAFVSFYIQHVEKETKIIVEKQAEDSFGLDESSAKKVSDFFGILSGNFSANIGNKFARENYLLFSLYALPDSGKNDEKFLGILTQFFKIQPATE